MPIGLICLCEAVVAGKFWTSVFADQIRLHLWSGAWRGGDKGHNALGAEKSQQCLECFLQYCTFAPKDRRFEHGGAADLLVSDPGRHLTSAHSPDCNVWPFVCISIVCLQAWTKTATDHRKVSVSTTSVPTSPSWTIPAWRTTTSETGSTFSSTPRDTRSQRALCLCLLTIAQRAFVRFAVSVLLIVSIAGQAFQDQPHHDDHGLRFSVQQRQHVVQELGQADQIRQRRCEFKWHLNLSYLASLFADILPSCCRSWHRQLAFQALACRRLPLNKIKNKKMTPAGQVS